jgi:hypothetical protein
MLKNHYLNDDNIIGASSVQLSNGEITEITTILLKEIDIAGIKMHNESLYSSFVKPTIK